MPKLKCLLLLLLFLSLHWGSLLFVSWSFSWYVLVLVHWVFPLFFVVALCLHWFLLLLPSSQHGWTLLLPFLSFLFLLLLLRVRLFPLAILKLLSLCFKTVIISLIILIATILTAPGTMTYQNNSALSGPVRDPPHIAQYLSRKDRGEGYRTLFALFTCWYHASITQVAHLKCTCWGRSFAPNVLRLHVETFDTP